MRLLLDEATDPQLARVLTALRHPSDHVRDLGMSGAADAEVVNRARDYDALVTLDLYRQEDERLAANEAMLSGAKVIRIRFGRREDETLMGQTRALVVRWSEIERAVVEREDIRLITITGSGNNVRARTVEQIADQMADQSS